MILFLYEGAHENRGEALIQKALAAFRAKKGLETLAGEALVCRTPNGKPYFDGSPICFSVSHTGSLWACVLSLSEIGLDIQEVRPVRHEQLAARVFTPAEQAFVKEHGSMAFFEIWVRKEACVKLFGTGIAKDFGRFSMIQGGKVADEIDLDGEPCFFSALEIKPGVKCAICSREKGLKVWTKILN